MKKITIRLSFILLAAICLAQSQPAGKTSVAIYPIKPAGSADKATASALTALLSSELTPSSRLYVIEEAMLKAVMERQAMNVSDACDDTSCQVEIGKLVKAQKMITGDLVKLGTLYILSLKLINVQTGAMEFSTKDQCECTENQLLQLVSVAGAKVRNHFGEAVPIQKLPQATPVKIPVRQEAASPPGYQVSSVAMDHAPDNSGNSFIGAREASDCPAYQDISEKQMNKLQKGELVIYDETTHKVRNANKEVSGMMIIKQPPDKVWELMTHPSDLVGTGFRVTLKNSNQDGSVSENCIRNYCYQTITTYDLSNAKIIGRLDPAYHNAILDYQQSIILYKIENRSSLVVFTVWLVRRICG